ncbi:MAG TPA: cupin domain-containing protein [Gemmatimonas sp.]|nr:cupin domain-containing protein [Gemmatimonas sp.]
MKCSPTLQVALFLVACTSSGTGRSLQSPSRSPALNAGIAGRTAETLGQATQPRTGLVLAPGAGERLTYCERPLVLTLKVDSVTAPTTRLVAGMGELRGDEGEARHSVVDEILFVVSGWGYAAFGSDTVPLGPGSVVHVPPGTSHRIVSTGAIPMRYHFVVGPSVSAAAFRRAAARGCLSGPTSASGALPPAAPPSPTAGAPWQRATVLAAGEGPRVNYCLFPLVITNKIDTTSVPATRMTAAAGTLRRGMEVGTHPAWDEVVLITHGRGRAFIGADTTAVEAGSVTFTPAGTTHGFINDGDDTLDYFIVYSGSFGRSAFRALASKPGRYCPSIP